MGPQHLSDGFLHIKQSKTKTRQAISFSTKQRMLDSGSSSSANIVDLVFDNGIISESLKNNSPQNVSQCDRKRGEMEVKKKIISLLASAMIAATSATATDSWAQQQKTSATDPMSASGPPAPNSTPTYARPGISGNPIPSSSQNGSKQLGGFSKPVTAPKTVAPRLPPVQAFE